MTTEPLTPGALAGMESRTQTNGAAFAASPRDDQDLQFLADAGALLGATLDIEGTLDRIARQAVRRLADWCVAEVADSGGNAELTQIAHAQPDRAEIDRLWRRHLAPGPRRPPSFFDLARDNAAHPLEAAALLPRLAHSEQHLALLRSLNLSAALVLPLAGRGQVFGAMVLLREAAAGAFTPEACALAEEYARRASQALDNARIYREARDAIQLRDEFLSTAAHELKTPITTIKGTAQLLVRAYQQGQLDPARTDRWLQTLSSSSDRLASLTANLLDVSRIRVGALPIDKQSVDLCHTVRATADRLRDRFESPYRLTLDLPPEPVPLLVDALRLDQVLTNLLDNARRFSPDGGEIRVEVRANERGGCLLAVHDRGIGLPKDSLASIFEPFQRAANASQRHLPGLGLGLNICRGIVERHGGHIWAESPGDGRGSSIYVWLPNPATAHADGVVPTAT